MRNQGASHLRALLAADRRKERIGEPGYCPVSGKVMRNQAEVDQELARYRAMKAPRAPRMRAYRCDDCKAWHITSMTTKAQKKARQRSRTTRL